MKFIIKIILKRLFPHKNEKLSRREAQVLMLAANGLNAKENGDILHISECTVVSHRNRIIKKFHSRNLIEAVYKALLGMQLRQ